MLSYILLQRIFYVTLDGAYAAAFYHAKECVRLEPGNLSYKEFLLFFYEIPDKLLDREMALQIAREILNEEPNRQVARKLIKNITRL